MLTTAPFFYKVTKIPDYQPYTRPTEPVVTATPHSREVSRLLTAAVVSRQFCRLLLSDPLGAVKAGYNGENFVLSLAEIEQLCSIKSASLADFARQLLRQDGNCTEKKPEANFVRQMSQLLTT